MLSADMPAPRMSSPGGHCNASSTRCNSRNERLPDATPRHYVCRYNGGSSADIRRANGMDPDEDGRWLTYSELADARGIDRQSARRLASRLKWRRQTDNHQVVRVYVPLERADRPRRQRDMSTDASADTPADTSADMSRAISALEAAIAALRERAEADAGAVAGLREHLEQANNRAEMEHSRADRAEQGRDAERAQADALRDRLNAMQAQLADAHAALQAAEVANTRADTERERADRAEAGRDGERVRADELRARIEALQAQLTARQEVVDAAEAIRRADDARLALSRWARLRQAWRG